MDMEINQRNTNDLSVSDMAFERAQTHYIKKLTFEKHDDQLRTHSRIHKTANA